jgi:hypothetical protein
VPDAHATTELRFAEAAAAYRRDGVAVLRGVLTPAEVDVARVAVDEVLDRPGPLAIIASGPDDPGRFVEDFRRAGDVPAIAGLARHSAAPRAAAELMGARCTRFFHDHVLVKEPGTRAPTPWHQDLPYYGVDGDQVVSLWIPLDPVPAASALRVAAGSHRRGWMLPRTFGSGEAKWFPEGSMPEVPDIDAAPDAHGVVTWDLQPGDAIAFHGLSLHAAAGTVTRRRVLSLRYVGDDARWAGRPWRTSPPFPELTGVLADGDPLDHPLFPVVWRPGHAG